MTYKDLIGCKWNSDSIPKWIFRSGPDSIDDLPTFISDIYANTLALNPGYKLFYFDDEDCIRFIKDEWGDDYLSLYDVLIPTAYKSDLFRYLLLYKYGGIWGDMTQQWWQPYDNIITGVNRVFCRDRFAKLDLYNAVMMVKAGDRVIKNAIDISIKNIRDRCFGYTPLHITGPGVLGKAFRLTQYHTFNINESLRGIIDTGLYNNSMILKWQYDVVTDLSGDKLFQPKTDGHIPYLYKAENIHYAKLWYAKKVFKPIKSKNYENCKE